ncbi:DUF3158 family protein [Ursidibacter sp. B-7004-1]
MNKSKIYRLIPEGMYKDLTQKHNLNGILRLLFSPIDDIEQYQYISDQIKEVRQSLSELQDRMVDGIKTDNVMGVLPLLFVRDTASRSEACYLRWRNLRNSKSGENAWREILLSPNQPKVVKDSLVQIEKERITLNMQMAILTHIVRQLRECSDKIQQIEMLAQEENE